MTDKTEALLVLVLLFLGPPILAAIILCVLLNIPFRFLRFPSRDFKIYWGARLGFAIFGLLVFPAFKIAGGFKKIKSSEFSPIGTDEVGVAIIWITIGLLAFGIISLFELLSVLVRRHAKRTRANLLAMETTEK